METARKPIAVIGSIRVNSGSGFRIGAIAKYLAREGRRVVMTGIGSPAGGAPPGVMYAGVPDGLALPFLALLSFLGNIAALLRFRPRDMIVSKPLPPSFLPAALYAAFSGARIILDVDDLEHDYWRDKPFYRRILRWTERYAVKRADVITTHSKDLERYLVGERGVGPAKIWSLAQGIDTELFPLPGDVGSLAARWRLEDRKVVVYAAHFTVAVKDFDFILRIMHELITVEKNAVLVVIGDGPALPAYRSSARDRGLEEQVRFVGYVPHQEMGKYFALAHAAINYMESTPSNVCRASIKLREYLLSGLPVVCNEVSEDVRQFMPFLRLFPEGDPAAGAAKLSEALREGVSGRRNDAAADYVRRNFSWERIIADFAKQLGPAE